MSRSETRCTSDSLRLRYSIRSAMVPILSLCSAAKSMRSGSRAMPPSSRMISHSTAAGESPARRARSQQASVCPARTSTPPGCAMSGNTWPGWTMSSGLASGAAATLMVSARSCAEMPVEMPSAASIEVVKLVPWRERFCSTIGRRPRRCACASVTGMQIRPRPCLARKLIFSGVTKSAAKTRSPSFSRCSSSTRITISPARIAETMPVIGLMAAASLRIARILCFFYSCVSPSAAPVFSRMRADLPARAQVIELGAAHVALALHLDRGDQRRVGLERALDAFTRRYLAHDERGIQSAVALGDHHAFERLQPLPLALDDVDVHHHGVARGEIRHLAAQPLDLFLLECLNQIHVSSCTLSGTPPAASFPLRSAASPPAGRAA